MKPQTFTYEVRVHKTCIVLETIDKLFLFCFNFLPDIPEDADYLLQFTIQTIQRKQFTQ